VIELVVWRDAHAFREEPNEAPDDYLIETVGWVEEDGRWLRIIQEVLPDDDGRRGVTRVPIENVVQRIPLVKLEPA
jgi:hypothetical protein